MMKKTAWVVLIMVFLAPVQQAHAQFVIADIIKQAVVKVIKAVDLKIQRLQNKTIWLQNAQKTLENEMSKLQLTEISDWVEKQRKLYDDYFQELWRVKAALANYYRVKAIIERQVQLVREYQIAWALFQQDKMITPEELQGMKEIYSGLLTESAHNLEGLFLVINSFQTQMSDAHRMSIINEVSTALEANLMDLKKYNEQARLISLQRATERGEIEYVKKLYGL